MLCQISEEVHGTKKLKILAYCNFKQRKTKQNSALFSLLPT